MNLSTACLETNGLPQMRVMELWEKFEHGKSSPEMTSTFACQETNNMVEGYLMAYGVETVLEEAG